VVKLVEELPLEVVDAKSPLLYRIHTAPIGITSAVNVNVCVDPSTAPSPVYATVVTTVDFTLEVQYVESPPPATAGVDCCTKPGGQQKAVVSVPDVPAVLSPHPNGQMPGE
jgi:hypothetical protein